MKKLFFLRSHSNNSSSNNQLSPPPAGGINKSGKNKHGSDDPDFGSTPSLRRSFSFSSGNRFDGGKGPRNNANQTGSPCSSTGYYYSNQPPGRLSSRSRPQTPERLQTRSERIDAAMVPNAHRANSDLSEDSLYCSSNVSSSILDRYIDGEQELDERLSKTNSSQFDKRPPMLQLPAARDARQRKPKSQSFREAKITPKHCNESPRELAKHVVERLSSQSHFLASKEFEHQDSPITIDDIYGRTFNNGCSNVYPEGASSENLHAETSDGSPLHEKTLGFLEKDAVVDNDVQLFRKFEEAENRAAILSQEFGMENYLECRGYSVADLVQMIRSLTEEKVNMAREVSTVLEDRIAEKRFLTEKLKLARVELGAQTRRLTKEKNELQLTLEKELDRRSSEWSLKLDKLQEEEHRLRERVRELAEQNVALQREVSAYSENEANSRNRITLSEKQLGDLSDQCKEAMEENHYLQSSLSEMQEKARAAEEERDCIRRNYEDKVAECKNSHQSISRLQRTCNEQEKTIDGLRGLCEKALGKNISQESLDFGSAKLQVEHMRLTEVEHGLRKEVESYRAEVDSLRRENIDLLNRLKKDGPFSTFKLDQELESRVSCLEYQIVQLLMESTQLGRKLIESLKINGQASAACLDGQALVECEVKLKGLERAAENVTSSLRTVSSVLQEKPALPHEKYCLVRTDTQSASSFDELYKWNEHKSEDIVRSALKAETLLTSLLREKLYSKELDLEQLQAELAAAVRGNDILKCELQSEVDNFSCLNHKMKELELQTMKKGETINQLQGDLQECQRELAIARGILPKVSEERDMLWEEVKQYSEKNMLLNSEMNVLRKKIETLDEEILLKEGQISILKDSLGRPFGLLGSPDSTDNFRWPNKH
ncbi:ATP binding protein [Striga asiatica]|uniref:ATP binding protein n=1 Tax=Striga asiatica TaxID=4170 RepID=A0A5A7RCF0_STRAF|nr:ATP binding protein [Striga asiatica]